MSSGSYLNDVDGDNIPGQAGVDYPVYASVPEGTSFRCRDYEYAGYFADVDADCQVITGIENIMALLIIPLLTATNITLTYKFASVMFVAVNKGID